MEQIACGAQGQMSHREPVEICLGSARPGSGCGLGFGCDFSFRDASLRFGGADEIRPPLHCRHRDLELEDSGKLDSARAAATYEGVTYAHIAGRGDGQESVGNLAISSQFERSRVSGVRDKGGK